MKEKCKVTIYDVKTNNLLTTTVKNKWLSTLYHKSPEWLGLFKGKGQTLYLIVPCD